MEKKKTDTSKEKNKKDKSMIEVSSLESSNSKNH